MKIVNLIFSSFFVLAIGLNSCSETPEKQPTQENSALSKTEKETTENIEVEEAADPIELKWITIEGKMGLYEQQIFMELTIEGDKVSGSYFYAKHQKNLQLSGTFYAPSESYELTESYKGKPTGFISFKIVKDVVNGNWKKSKIATEREPFTGMLNISPNTTKENYSPKFEKYAVTHTIDMYTSPDEPNEIIEVTDELLFTRINKNSAVFSYSVTGSNAHMGSVDGLASSENGRDYIFRGMNECELTFSLKNTTMQVEETDCSYYRGMRAYFGNALKKVR